MIECHQCFKHQFFIASSSLQIEILGQGKSVYLRLKYTGIFIITVVKYGCAHWSNREAIEIKLKKKQELLHFPK